MSGKRKRGRPKKTWRKQKEEETGKIGLNKKDTLYRAKWRDGVRENAEGIGIMVTRSYMYSNARG